MQFWMLVKGNSVEQNPMTSVSLWSDGPVVVFVCFFGTGRVCVCVCMYVCMYVWLAGCYSLLVGFRISKFNVYSCHYASADVVVSRKS